MTCNGGTASVPHGMSLPLQGSGYCSEAAREGDEKPETLPHMFVKDWMLNLDALEVRHLTSSMPVGMIIYVSSTLP